MTTCLMAFIVALVTGVAATLSMCKLAPALGAVDEPDSFRKVHKEPTPLLGGIAIYIAFLAPMAALSLFDRHLAENLIWGDLSEHGRELQGLIVGATAALALGVWDDARNLGPRRKLVLQAVAACIAVGGGLVIREISNPFGEPLRLGVFSVPVTLFWFLGCMNAVNLLDGLDGLAAGVSFFATVTLMLANLYLKNYGAMLLMASLSGALFGFLVFNFHPASIFLGDSGSMLLGYLLAALSVWGARTAQGTVALFVPFIALGLPVFDTALAILRRWARKLPFSAADRGHIHHVLHAAGLSQSRVVLSLYLLCALFGVTALLAGTGRSEVLLMVLACVLLLVFVCIRFFRDLGFYDVFLRFSREYDGEQTGLNARMSVERACVQMTDAATRDEMWDGLCRAFASIGLERARLTMRNGDPAAVEVLTWPDGGDGAAWTDEKLDHWRARLGIREGDHLLGELEVAKPIDNGLLVGDSSELVDRLRRELVPHLKRFAPGHEHAAPSRSVRAGD